MPKSPMAFLAIACGLLAVSAVLILAYLWRMKNNRALNVQERQARFMLVAVAVAVVDYALMAGALRMPWEPSLGMFGLLGLTGFAGSIGKAERRAGKIIEDERDREIVKTASMAGFAAFWGSLYLAWGIAFLALGPNGIVKVNVGLLGFVLMCGMMLIFCVRSLVILTLYRKDAPHGEAN